MYFPYFRGRQYELIALRELASKNLLGSSIIPVVEPVKLSPTLIKTIKTYVEQNKQIAIIDNPLVGSFLNDMQSTEDNPLKSEFTCLLSNSNIIKSHIINSHSKQQLDYWEKCGVERSEWLVINNDRDLLEEVYQKEFKEIDPQYVLIPDESAFRRKVKNNRVLLADKFEKKDRNVDYQNIKDEFFSDDPLYFNGDGL